MNTATTPSKLVRSFLNRRGYIWTDQEKEWLRVVFGLMLKVARSRREFTVDDIWFEIDSMSAKKKMPKSNIDHRVIGPMLRHMVSEGLLGSSGYYTKSTRQGGGSRPVTIWESYISTRTKAAA